MQIIKSWADIDLENHIFFNLVNEINEVINPLITHFGLDSFNYHRIYNDNSQIRTGNTPNWQRHYLKQKLYQQSIFELPAHNYVKSRIIWSNIDTHNVILQEAKKFGINYGITLVEPLIDGCEFYFLGTTTNNRTVINKYLSNFYLLEKFIANFHNAAASIFAKIEPQRLIIKDWQQNTLKFASVNIIDKFTFLASIYGYSFTRRELDCIPLLLKGLSAKQIALHLEISFRTVEVYINNLKYKTKTTNKSELIFLLETQFG